MRSQIFPIVLASTSLAIAQNASSPGYNGYPDPIASTIAANESLSFGQHYAVLNLDLINGLVGNVNETDVGKRWINATANWINAYPFHPFHSYQIWTNDRLESTK